MSKQMSVNNHETTTYEEMEDFSSPRIQANHIDDSEAINLKVPLSISIIRLFGRPGAKSYEVINVEQTAIKLTKIFLKQVPTGQFVMSCVGKSIFETVFAEAVCESSAFEAQWKRVVTAGANRQPCMLFNDEEHYQSWLQNQRNQ